MSNRQEKLNNPQANAILPAMPVLCNECRLQSNNLTHLHVHLTSQIWQFPYTALADSLGSWIHGYM